MSLQHFIGRAPRSVPLRAAFIAVVVGALLQVAVLPASAETPTTLVDSTSSQIAYSGTWRTNSSVSEEGGSVSYLSSTGSASLTFMGTSVSLITRLSDTSGFSDVSIDGTPVTTIDGYSSTTKHRQTIFTSAALPGGEHTITVTRTGKRNSSSTGTNLIIDAFRVADAAASPTLAPTASETAVGAGTYENGASAITKSGTWAALSSIHDNGGSIHFASRSASVSLTFTGTSIEWLSRKTSSSGINDVLIDGVKVASVDRYSATTLYKQSVWKTSSLAPGIHTVKVAYTGQKNAKSTSENVILDAFVVSAPASVSPTVPAIPAVPVGVYDNLSPAIRYSGSWSRIGSGSDNGGSSAYLNSTGSASLTFTGNAVKWISRMTPSSGIANVYLDGAKVATVDRYSASTTYQNLVFERTGLPEADHTLKIEWSGKSNAAATGKNLLLDAIIVPDTIAPARPIGASAAASPGGNVVLSWQPVTAPDLADYRVYGVAPTGDLTLIGRAAKNDSSFTSIGLPAHTDLGFTVSATDTAGNESAKSTTMSLTTGETPVGSYRYAECPAATVTVANLKDVKNAVAAAGPGDVIRMAPGIYSGQLDLTANGTSEEPIWLCGSRDVVIDGGGFAVNSPITVSFSSHLIVTGMTATNALKGVTVRSSDHVTVSDMLVDSIGYEGVHLRSNTTDSVVVGNVIRRTGRLDPFYGEGVYIGSSVNNWCNLTDCVADRSDRNAIVDNVISLTGSDLIEAKEGTTGGVIRGNSLNGADGMLRTQSWVMIGGNGWSVLSNNGTTSSENGFRVNGSVEGWGFRNLFAANTANVNASGYGFKLYELNGTGTSDTIVSCGNVVRGAVAGFGNIQCTP